MRAPTCAIAAISLVLTPVAPVAARASHTAAPLPTVVEGVLQGAAPSAVTLYAWPPTVGLEVGDVAELIPVAAGPLERDGSFELDSKPTPSLQDLAAQNGGYVNFELRGPDDVPLLHFFRYLASGSDVWQAGPGEAAVPLRAQAPADYDPSQRGQGTCGSMKLEEKTIEDTFVGELRSEGDTLEAKFTYGQRADSTITSGIARKDGRFQAGGEHKIANTSASESAVAWIVDHGPHIGLATPFYYGRFRCSMGAPYETVKSLGWKGDTTKRQDLPFRGCGAATQEEYSEYQQRGEFHRAKDKAATISKAATAFGFTFGSQSGYSQWVRADWSFGTAPKHVLCGTDGKPPRSSPYILAGVGLDSGPTCRPGRPC